MKKVYILVAMLLPILVQAQETEIKVKSKVNNVTVFIQGAQVERSTRTSIPKGNSTFVFDKISNHIIKQSIQASGNGAFTIFYYRFYVHWINFINS